MSAVRALRPLVRQSAAFAQRRFNSSSAPILYSATAVAQGARGGTIEGSEGLKVSLAMPKSLGGPGGASKTNPEELFAAGYGACFQSAMNLVAGGMGIRMPRKTEDSIIETTVHLVGDLKKGDLGIKVDMVVKVKGVDKADLEKLVEKTKDVCPYSRATKGNVVTDVKVISL
ncbi:Putative OsmC-like protein [[Torrubiella] hemipterigena]|uniref:Putative OsmC-like protein n=1 Tax=[Torrubiella] hemipterigena TaxID=1531966 RepID=A0A0A1SY30_9HYPO|nr:Putative OsmC-like protein [[Torrubiella] hemipterigena]